MNNIRPIKKALAIPIVGGMLSAFAVVSANADTNLNCDAYAKAAIAEQQQNLQLGCGFSGPAWQDNYQAHFAWCQSPGIGITHISGEDASRLNALAQCKQAKTQTIPRPANAPTERACNNYRDLMIGLSGDGELFGLRCHQAQADYICKQNGYGNGVAGGRGVGFDSKSNDQSTSSFGVSADGASTWWPEEGGGRPCYGNCAHFTMITCKG
jgi:hypothetical protein